MQHEFQLSGRSCPVCRTAMVRTLTVWRCPQCDTAIVETSLRSECDLVVQPIAPVTTSAMPSASAVTMPIGIRKSSTGRTASG